MYCIDHYYPFDGTSVNDGIDKEMYLGEKVVIQYPRVDGLVALVKEKGPGCLLFKRDLRRAYRQLPIDPGDMHLVGYSWDDHVFADCRLTMGLRSAAYLCQRFTTALAFLFFKLGYAAVNYLDDFGGAEVPERAQEAYQALGDLLSQAGIEESVEKACPPSTCSPILGNQQKQYGASRSLIKIRI